MKTITRNCLSIFFGILISMLAVTSLKAQYSTALGVRAGGTTGLTLKHFTSNTTAVEGILGFFGNGFSLTGMWEKHRPAFDVEGMRWYYGPGIHVAFYNEGRPYNSLRDTGYRDRDAVGFGVNGIVGLEYRLPDNVPLAFSLDLKPFLEIDTNGDAGVAIDPGLGIKFFIK